MTDRKRIIIDFDGTVCGFLALIVGWAIVVRVFKS